MAFYKIDPRKADVTISIESLGLKAGEFFTVRVVGDFRAWQFLDNPAGVTLGGVFQEFRDDVWQNTVSVYDGLEYYSGKTNYFADPFSTLVQFSGENTVIARQNDPSLSLNSDPDSDYGLIIEASGLFTERDDTVDLRNFSNGAFPISELALLPSYTNFVGLFQLGGDGNDTVHLPDADENQLLPTYSYSSGTRFKAGSGNDTIYGGDLDDLVEGGMGNDELYGGKGDDTLFGQENSDSLYGDDGEDSLWGEAGKDALYGGADNDYLHGGDGDDDIFGGAGDDVLIGAGGEDVIEGFIGSDTLYGGGEDDYLEGGAGEDTIFGENGSDFLVGGYSLGLESFVRDGDIAELEIIDDKEIDLLDGGLGVDFYFAGIGDKISNFEVGESIELLGTNTDIRDYFAYLSGGALFIGALSDSLIPKTVVEVTNSVSLSDLEFSKSIEDNAIFTRTASSVASNSIASAKSIDETASQLKAEIDDFNFRSGSAEPGDALFNSGLVDVAKYLATDVLEKLSKDPKLVNFFAKVSPLFDTVLGLQEMVQTIILDAGGYYDLQSPAVRAAAYTSALAGLLPGGSVAYHVGTYALTQYAKAVIDSVALLLKGISVVLPSAVDSEGNFEANEEDAYIIFPNGDVSASLSGDLGKLDGETVFNFDGNDKIVVRNEQFESGSLTVTYGSAILDIDADLDGEIDSTITLKGDFTGAEFEVETVGSNTEISLRAQIGTDSGVGTTGSDQLIGTDGDDSIYSLAGDLDRMTGGAGADEFVFGSETSNGRRERDVIADFEIEADSIVRAPVSTDIAGTNIIEDLLVSAGSIRWSDGEVAEVVQTGGGIVLILPDDGDAIYLRNSELDLATLVNDFSF